MSILLDAYQSIQNMSVANKGTGTTAQPTIAGFGGSVNQAGYGESYGTDDTPYGGDTGKTTTKALTSGGNSITSSDIPNSGMSDIQKAQTYTGLGTKALSAGSEIAKGLNYPTVGGYLGKGAEVGSALLSAYSAYKIATGEAHSNDYAQVASTGSKYLLGGSGGQYISPALSVYNLSQGSKNPIDYATATQGAITGAQSIYALDAFGESLAGAGGAASSGASSATAAGLGTAGSAIGAAGAGYVLPAILDSVGALPKEGVERGVGVTAAGTGAGALLGAATALGGPLGAVAGAAGAGVYGFISGNSGLTEGEIRDQQARAYAQALQDYYKSNSNYTYTSENSPFQYTKYFFGLDDTKINNMIQSGTFRDYIGKAIQEQQNFAVDFYQSMNKGLYI